MLKQMEGAEDQEMGVKGKGKYTLDNVLEGTTMQRSQADGPAGPPGTLLCRVFTACDPLFAAL